MALFEYSIERLNPPSLKYDAVEKLPPSGAVVQLTASAVAGAYPDIEAHIASVHSITFDVPLVFVQPLGDTFDQASATWTYYRNGHTVVVVDPPRTVAEISGWREP